MDLIRNMWSNKESSSEPCIYQKRIKCFEVLTKLQQSIYLTDNEYVAVSIIEGKPHTNAWNRLELLQSEYNKEYTKCKDIINTN
jgi:hypothetical protein